MNSAAHGRVARCSTLVAKRDCTSAETLISLSSKRTSPFKSAWGSVQSTTGSLGVGFSGQRLCYL